MAKKRPPFNMEMQIRGANRRLFARSPLVQQKLEESRQEFPRYKKDGTLAKKPWVKRQCEVCREWVSSSKIAVDHVDPVVPPNGFPSDFDMWDRIILFLKRLWCDISNLQRICDTCHDKKTYSERITRLLKQYSHELDTLEGIANSDWIAYQINSKLLLKTVNKYVSKKKTPELKSIVQRAQILKDFIKNKEKKYV